MRAKAYGCDKCTNCRFGVPEVLTGAITYIQSFRDAGYTPVKRSEEPHERAEGLAVEEREGGRNGNSCSFLRGIKSPAERISKQHRETFPNGHFPRRIPSTKRTVPHVRIRVHPIRVPQRVVLEEAAQRGRVFAGAEPIGFTEGVVVAGSVELAVADGRGNKRLPRGRRVRREDVRRAEGVVAVTFQYLASLVGDGRDGTERIEVVPVRGPIRSAGGGGVGEGDDRSVEAAGGVGRLADWPLGRIERGDVVLPGEGRTSPTRRRLMLRN